MSRIVIAEYPKSGGTWIVSLLADVLNFYKRDIYANENNPGFDFYKHPWYKNANDLSIPENSVIKSHELAHSKLNRLKACYFHLVRDGRDVTVSRYFYEKDFCVKNGIRKDFNISFDEYVEKTAYEWRDYVKSWLKFKTPIIRYEDFLSNTHSEVRKFISLLDYNNISDIDIQHAIGQNTKDRTRKSLSKTFKFNTFVRKGVSGDWKNHFSKNNTKIFEAIAGEALIATGYKYYKKNNAITAYNSPAKFPDKVFVDSQLYANSSKLYDIPVVNSIRSISKKNISLKVVSISTSDFGGAGKAAMRIHQGLLNNDVDATMLVLDTVRKEPHIKALPAVTKNGQMTSALSMSKDFTKTRKLYQNWRLLMHQFPTRPEGLELFSDTTTLVDLGKIKDIAEADIIHLHWVAGILDYSELPTSLFNKPVVWTLHDMNPFTGGCHYTGECFKYEKQCGACPQLGSTIEKDLSHQIWIEKQIGYKNTDLTVVTPSKWLGSCVKRSLLFKNFPLRIIANGLPTHIFKPNNGSKIRKKYKISSTDQIVLFGAAAVTTKRKGFQYLLSALKRLSADQTFTRKLHLFVFGNLPDSLKLDFPYPLVSVGHINDEYLLSDLYNAADVFVTPSIEDNLPNTAIEALACGTPIVAFDTGGLAEIITHFRTGYLAPKADTDQLAEGIRWTLDSMQNSDTMRNQCRADALAKYDQGNQAKAYKSLYYEIIEKHAQKQNCVASSTISPNYQRSLFSTASQKDGSIEEISPTSVNDNPNDDYSHLSQNTQNTERSINEDRTYHKAKKLVENDKIAEALDLMENYIPESINKARLHNDIGVLAYRTYNYEKAFHHYKKAVEIEPQDTVYKKNLADFIYFIKNDAHSALKIYISLLKSNPADTEILFAIGRISTDMGHTEDADTFFGRILEIDPDHIDARKALGHYQENLSTFTKSREYGSYTFNRMAGKNSLANQSILVSAIVSVYNAERFLEGCLEDLLGQTIEDRLEIIVVDSGSEQNEGAIVRQFQEKHSQIHYIRTEERETVYAAWNRGIEASRGKYITNANCDDRHRPDAFEIMVNTLEQKGNVSLVYADCLITETENETFFQCTPVGRFRWHDWNRELLLNRGCFMGPQPMWRRSLHDEYGLFDADFITSGDYEFWLRVSQTHDFYHIPQLLGLYLRSPQSIEHRNRDKQALENKQLLTVYREASRRNEVIRQRISSQTPSDRSDDHSSSSIPDHVIALIESEQYASSQSALIEILRDNPNNWHAYELLVDVMLQSGQEMDIPHLLRHLENRPDLSARILALIGCGYEAVGDLNRAKQFADQAIPLAADCARAWNLKGVIAYKNGNQPEAAQFFQEASECDPEWGDPLTNMGMIHWDQGAYDKAVECYEIGFKLSPAAPNVASTYHMAISESGQYERAKPIFEDIVARHPDFCRGHFLLIDILIRLEAYHAALNQIQTVLLRFGVDPQLLEAAKAVRAKVGPMTIPKGKRPSLSLCMIVKDEERYLPRCLESLNPLVDEMIIVDTGSTDATRDIAEIFGAKVFDYQWKDDFADARNHSLNQASGDWILVMDADEIMDPRDHGAIRKLIKNSQNDKVAYLVTTRNYTDRISSTGFVANNGQYDHEEGKGWVPSIKVRLFKNRQNVHFVYPVHEQVDPVLLDKGIALKECDFPVHHYGKLDSNRMAERVRLYYNLGRKKLEVLGYDKMALKELAIQASILSRWNEAAEYWERYIEIEPKNSKAHMHIARAMSEMGDFEKANHYALAASHLSDNSFESLYNLCISELQLGKADKALLTSQRMVKKFSEDMDGRLLHGVALICNGSDSEGMTFIKSQIKEGLKKSLRSTAPSIISAIKSAGFEKWSGKLIEYFSQLECYKDSGSAFTGSNSDLKDRNKRPENTSQKLIDSLIGEATCSYERQEYAASYKSLLKMISNRSDHWAAYELLVDTMLQSGQEAMIAEHLRPLEDHKQLPARILALIGCGYEASGDLKLAAYFVDQALSLQSDCARAWNLKGVLAYQNSNQSKAAEFFQKAAECEHDWGDPWTNMGTLHWENGYREKALQCFEAGFRLSPTAPHVATSYHLAVSEDGQYQRAREVFEEVVARHPDFRKGRFLLIDILIRLEAYPAALDQIEDVLVRFGADAQLLEAAKTVRTKVGPLTVPKGTPPSLSLCMIVKNEEKYLPHCLRSLKPLVDEMIIVDTGSTDNTRDIAEVFGAQVFDYKWNDDFAAARNHSLEKAAGDWILVMDADEIIDPCDHDSIRRIIKKPQNDKTAYLVTTRNYTHNYNGIGWEANDGAYSNSEAGCGWIPSTKTRLFRNMPQIRFEYPVHELVDPAIEKNGFRVRHCDVPVHHYGFLDQKNVDEKGKQYHTIGKTKLHQMKNDPKAIQELAVQASLVGDYYEAINLWRQLVKIQPKNIKAYINLSAAYGKIGDYRKAKSAALKAMKMSPKTKEGRLNLGRSEFFLGRFDEACMVFDKLVRSNGNYYSAIFMLGASQICCGDSDKGISTIYQLKALSIWKSLPHAFMELAGLLTSAGFEANANDLLVSLSNLGIFQKESSIDLVSTGSSQIGDSQATLPLAS